MKWLAVWQNSATRKICLKLKRSGHQSPAEAEALPYLPASEKPADVALDTNLLARLLLQDDAAQHAKVKALFKTRQIFTAPVTVLLELVWVLESRDCSPLQVSQGLTALLDLPNFKPEQAVPCGSTAQLCRWHGRRCAASGFKRGPSSS
jgi:hypothetical protein